MAEGPAAFVKQIRLVGIVEVDAVRIGKKELKLSQRIILARPLADGEGHLVLKPPPLDLPGILAVRDFLKGIPDCR